MKRQNASGLIFSFFGPPGSGKGTLAEQCARKLGCRVLSTGNLCRKHIASGTTFGKELEKYLSVGKLVPDELIVAMVKEWLVESINSGNSIILDGFPRTEKQAEAILKFLETQYPEIVFKVMLFEIPDDLIVKRVLDGRMVCENKECQAVFSSVVPPRKPGICDYCGSKLEKRADDTADVIRKRLVEFAGYKAEVLRCYTRLNIPIEKVDPVKYGPVALFDRFKEITYNNTGSKHSNEPVNG